MNSYRLGLSTDTQVGADESAGTLKMAATVGVVGLILFAIVKGPKKYRGLEGMRDVDARIRARGGNPHQYGW